MIINYQRITGCLFLLLASTIAMAQAPQKLWNRSYGGARSEALYGGVATADGGYIAVGTTTSANGDIVGKVAGSSDNDWWIVKFNNTGAIEKQVVFGSTGSDILYSIQPLKNGGYIACGFVTGNDRNLTGLTVKGGLDGAIVKLNNTLGVEWVKAYGGSGGEAFNDIRQKPDHGFIVSGYTGSNNGDIQNKLNGTSDDWWVMTTDSAGNIIHNKTFGGSGPSSLIYQERAFSVQCAKEGGYVITGSSSSNDGSLNGMGLGLSDYWVLKLDDTLGTVWSKTYGGASTDVPGNIIVTADSNFVVAGTTKSIDAFVHTPKGGGQNDVWIVKLDHRTGDTIWTRSYGGLKIDQVYGFRGIEETIDKGFIVWSSSTSADMDVTMHYGGSSNNSADAWIFKLNSKGAIQWDKTLGSTGIDNPQVMHQYPDGSYLFIGQSSGMGNDVDTNKGSNDVFLVKLAGCPAYTYLEDTICEGHSYLFNGIGRTVAGIYYDTLSMTSGCDSIIALALQVKPRAITPVSDTICKGGSYVFNGNVLTRAGIYYDTLTKANGCDSIISFTLVVDSIATPVINASGSTLSTGSYATYQWLNTTGNPIPGAVSRQYTATASGQYRVIATGANGCTDTSAVYDYRATGIGHEPALFDGMSLYPNPATDIVNIDIPGLKDDAVLTLSGIDGSLLKTESFSSPALTISLAQYPAGLYFIKVTTGNGSAVRRLIKK